MKVVAESRYKKTKRQIQRGRRNDAEREREREKERERESHVTKISQRSLMRSQKSSHMRSQYKFEHMRSQIRSDTLFSGGERDRESDRERGERVSNIEG